MVQKSGCYQPANEESYVVICRIGLGSGRELLVLGRPNMDKLKLLFFAGSSEASRSAKHFGRINSQSLIISPFANFLLETIRAI